MVETEERVEIEELTPEGMGFKATYRLTPDIVDIDEEKPERHC